MKNSLIARIRTGLVFFALVIQVVCTLEFVAKADAFAVSPVQINLGTRQIVTPKIAFTNSALYAPRFDHSATLLKDGRILAAGGNNRIEALTTAEIYDPLLQTWTSAGDMNLCSGLHAAVLLKNGLVLVAGGGNGNILKTQISRLTAIPACAISSTNSCNWA